MWRWCQILVNVQRVPDNAGVSMLSSQLRGWGFKPPQGQKFGLIFPQVRIANSALMTTMATHCQWKSKMADWPVWPPALQYKTKVVNASCP